MIRSKIAMGFFWVALAMMLHAWPFVPVAKGQGSRKDDIVFNSRGVPLAGSTVRVCAMPASGQPCTPLALIYSDAALTQALANPTTTDGLGNYFFYAAPGKYLIELSGPGITTKQLANVILPSDPSTPTFSSLSTTGAISAFSLNLTGNLTVNGSTTVIGNLASGTLNLTNQTSAPGTASAGTVNLYTKNDKRLYYKDDTGAEIGPISNTTGAQTNVTNTFTAAQNFDADLHSKGPNPYFDILRYGGYAAASPPTTTGTINSGSTTLTLAAAQDFANGQGIVVFKAGAATTLPTPTAPASVAPLGLTGGSTTFTYQWVAEDYFGGLTAAGPTGSTTAGQSSLGPKTVALTLLSRVGGVDTYTCASNCNIAVNSLINVAGFAGGSNATTNGTVVVNTTPTGTTFTVLATGYVDYSETASATANVLACNMVTPSGTLSGAYESKTVRYWLYRNGTLAAVVPGQDPFFIDCGQGVSGQPSYVPASAPGSAQAGYLATTISSGGGTTTLILANAAGTTASSQTVLHDNTPALRAAWIAALAAGGGTVMIPIVPANNMIYPFESLLDFTAISNPQNVMPRLQFSRMTLDQPFVLNGTSEIEGLPQTSTSFQYTPLGAVGGTANPMMMTNAFSHGGIRLSRIKFQPAGTGQVSVLTDETTGGGGFVGMIFDDIGFSGIAAPGVIIKGGFDFWFTRGVCSVGGTENGQWYAHPCVELTNSSSFLNTTAGQAPGRVYFDRMNFSGGTAIQLDNLPATTQPGTFTSGGGNLFLNGILHESNAGPTLRIFYQNGAFGYGVTMNDVVMSDATNGSHQALLEATGTTNFSVVTIKDSKGFSANPVVLGGGGTLAALCINNVFFSGSSATCGSTPNIGFTGSFTRYDGAVAAMTNGGRLTYSMVTPIAPGIAVSAGGAVPVGTIPYGITAVDADGKETVLSTIVNAVTTSGNQTVTVTPPALPSGAVGWFPYRNGVKAAVGGGAGNCPFALAPGANFVDTFSFTCATPPPSFTVAGSSYMSSTGIGTGQLKISNETVSAAPRAEQNVFLPGALSSTWTGATWTADKAITVTRVQAQVKTAPAGCAPNAVVRLTDGTTPVNLTISGAANDSGAITQNYTAGATLTVSVQTAAAGCTTSPADANVVVQYRMQ